jgi:hypothetical protein
MAFREDPASSQFVNAVRAYFNAFPAGDAVLGAVKAVLSYRVPKP